VSRILYVGSVGICAPAAQAQNGGYALDHQVSDEQWAVLLVTPDSAASAAPPRSRSTGCSRGGPGSVDNPIFEKELDLGLGESPMQKCLSGVDARAR
jgi:hypothetical protein